LSPRELAVRFTDEKKYFVSEASVYRLLLVMDSTNARIVESERALAGPIAARPERNRHPVDSEFRAKLERDLLDNPIERRQLRVHDQPKAEIGRRHAGGAAARARVSDEIGHIGPVRALHDADAAIGIGDLRRPCLLQHHAKEAGVGPFPDIAADVVEAVLVATERADRLRVKCERAHPVGFGLIARDPGLRAGADDGGP